MSKSGCKWSKSGIYMTLSSVEVAERLSSILFFINDSVMGSACDAGLSSE